MALDIIKHHKLLVEDFDPASFEYILEEKNSTSPSTLYVKGPYIMAEEVNKNKRKYSLPEVISEVNRYKKEMIDTNRSMGELNHPASAEVNPERACHLIVELTQDRNVFIGKSKILSTPLGLLVRSLINDGVRLGMSTRALGKLIEESAYNLVKEMRLIAVDAVADPSCTKAWVNGVLESRQYILNDYGQYEQAFDTFEESISRLPRHDVESYLKSQISAFIAALTHK